MSEQEHPQDATLSAEREPRRLSSLFDEFLEHLAECGNEPPEELYPREPPVQLPDDFWEE
jgi:hypothetical protein